MTEHPITFALIREGTSDDGLIPHLRELIVKYGAPAAIGTSRRHKGSTQERLEAVTAEGVDVDIIFVHRDADNRSATDRHLEVHSAQSVAQAPGHVVAVVPVQELEAWLITDEDAIRAVVGRPSGKEPLHLPRPSRVEDANSPKELLQQALLAASAKTGRRREQEKRNANEYRRRLLERLDRDGPVKQLASWQRLESDIAAAVSGLMSGVQSEI